MKFSAMIGRVSRTIFFINIENTYDNLCLSIGGMTIPQPSPERSRHGSPNGMEDNQDRQSPGPGACGRNGQQESEEVMCFFLHIQFNRN